MQIQKIIGFRFSVLGACLAPLCIAACDSGEVAGTRIDPIETGMSGEVEKDSGTVDDAIELPVVLLPDDEDASVGDAAILEQDAGMVACGGCSVETPLCDRETNECKACAQDAECITAELGDHCLEGRCVDCLTDEHCSSPEASTCDLSANVCVGCLDDAGCNGVMQAGHTLAVCSERECVECTQRNADACGFASDGATPLVCNSLLHACTTKPRGQESVCGACVSDTECAPGMRCVKERFGDQELGYVCQWTVGLADSRLDDCGAVEARPYNLQREEVMSIDGETVSVCALTHTTCSALRQFVITSCEMGDHSGCGEQGFDDGMCQPRVRGDDDSMYRCTLPCTVSEDCPRGHACNQEVPEQYCDLVADTCYGDGDCPVGTRCEEGRCR